MRTREELRAYEAAGPLAEELPYWGWLDDGHTCLTRSGELMAAARIRPAVTDGRTPEEIDRVLGLWQRLLSGLGADARLYFYLLRRPSSIGGAEEPGGSDIASVSTRKRQAFLAERVQHLDAYVVWSYDAGLRSVAGGSGSGLLSRLTGWRKRRSSAPSYLASDPAETAKTWRKKNAALVLATQSAVDVTGTPGASALLESIPTKLFLANPELPGEAYEAATVQADPLDPTTKYFLNRFVHDFHSRRRGTVEEQWTRSLRFLSTELANAAFQRDAGEVAATAAGTTETELQVEQVVLRLHPAPEPPHGATADFDLVHLKGEQEIRRERWSLTLRFEFLEWVPPELVVHNPMGILVTYLQADRALVTGQER